MSKKINGKQIYKACLNKKGVGSWAQFSFWFQTQTGVILTQQTLSNYKCGRSVPSSNMLMAISEFTGKALDYFYGQK